MHWLHRRERGVGARIMVVFDPAHRQARLLEASVVTTRSPTAPGLLVRALGTAMREARSVHRHTGEPARRYRDFTYRTRKSWSRRRRVVGDGLHAQALGRLHPLPRRRAHLPHEQCR